jgi:polysaccharide pyruvyl transferase WcaK-like protein
MPQRPLRICLIMHSTRSDNLGVGALTVSEVEILRGIARQIGRELEITVLDWKSHRPSYVGGPDIRIVDLDRRMILSPLGYFALARRSDMVIDIGAGDSFADIYGRARLRQMFILKFLTHLAGTPLVMAPQTVGPFARPGSKFLARLSMRLCKIVATRDRMSTVCIRDMGLQRAVIEGSDVALLLPYDPPAARLPGRPVKVGLNVSALLMNKGYTGRNEFGLVGDYPALVRDIIRHFLAHPDGCELHLVPHVLSPDPTRSHMEDDAAANAMLAAEFPAAILAPRFASPSEAKTYIADLDFFMGARMHACIAAFSTGVAVIPMAYSRKFEGLFGSLGYDRTVDCTNETNGAIMEKITLAYAARREVAQEAMTAFVRGRDKVQKYAASLSALLGGDLSHDR